MERFWPLAPILEKEFWHKRKIEIKQRKRINFKLVKFFISDYSSNSSIHQLAQWVLRIFSERLLASFVFSLLST